MKLAIQPTIPNFGGMTFLKLSGVSKKVGTGFTLAETHLEMEAGKKVAIAGETGSGKSSLLKMIAGLMQPDSGKILFQEEKVMGPDFQLVPGHPGIAYLSQHFELRNNYRVEELLEYANKIDPKKAEAIYDVCDIAHLVKRRTDQLSGGERQRIALARLLTTSPKLLLLDEPYSNLDNIHKRILKKVIREICDTLGITIMMVSHEPTDILSWADEIWIMKEGQIVQQGSPKEVYLHPMNEYVAALLGTYTLLQPQQLSYFPEWKGERTCNVLLRPEQFHVAKADSPLQNATITHIAFLGGYYELEILFKDVTLYARTTISDLEVNDHIQVILK
jgi:ABC-type sugar transport system ATPase subunit